MCPEPAQLPASVHPLVGQQGLGLPMAIFIVVIVGSILLALTNLNQSDAQGMGQEYQSMRAFYAAESGAQIGLNRILVGGTACASLTGFTFASAAEGVAGCVVDLSCDQLDVAGKRYFTVLSEAACGSGAEQGRRKIEVRARESL